jgi:GT2 family glycosyltransferase
MTPNVTVVVLAYGTEPHLVECIDALVASQGVDLEVILVDNGADTDAVRLAAARPRVSRLDPGTNLGYAGGCNVGAAEASGSVLVFVNSDALVRPSCLAALVRAVQDPHVGLATASLRLADSPDLLNSAGNPVHFLGFSWAGAFGERADEHDEAGFVASVSGATFAVRRDVWKALHGFDSTYFAYGEDVDLSIRCWEAGYRVVFVPEAVSLHHYEFSRNPLKYYLLERNRLINLLTLYEGRTTAWLIAADLPVELGLLVVSARDGWIAQKVQGWRWLLSHRNYLRARRAAVQSSRVVGDRDVVTVVDGRLALPEGFGMSAPAWVDDMLARYWDRVYRRITKG